MADTQTRISAILASLLVRESVLPADDFFQMGGDSLAANVLMTAIEYNYGLALDPMEIFERPNIGEFVAWLDTQLASGQNAR